MLRLLRCSTGCKTAAVGRHLWIDADVLLYEAAHASQKTTYYYKDQVFKDADQAKDYCAENELDYRTLRKEGAITSQVNVLPEHVAETILRQKIANVRNAIVHSEWSLVLSGGDENFRDEVAVTRGYKANRSNTPKPFHYDYVRALLHQHPRTICQPGIEADDVLGIALTDDPEAVLASVDKDLCQISGRHYDWGKELKFYVKPEDALYFFHLQCLTGDATDNIPGVPGLGPKKAVALLKDCRDNPKMQWSRVVEEYHGNPLKFTDGTVITNRDDYLNEQMRLVWILRKADEIITKDYYETTYL